MPMFILHANFAISDEKASLIQEDAVCVLSEELGKSKDFIVTLFNDSASIKFGQSKEPCSYVEIKNVGTLAPEQTAAMSSRICDLLHNHISVPKDRTYIEFQESERHLWGWNGKTFSK